MGPTRTSKAQSKLLKFTFYYSWTILYLLTPFLVSHCSVSLSPATLVLSPISIPFPISSLDEAVSAMEWNHAKRSVGMQLLSLQEEVAVLVHFTSLFKDSPRCRSLQDKTRFLRLDAVGWHIEADRIAPGTS